MDELRSPPDLEDRRRRRWVRDAAVTHLLLRTLRDMRQEFPAASGRPIRLHGRLR